MRILIVRNAYQKDTGGAEQYSFNLALSLKKHHYFPILATNQKEIQNKCKNNTIKCINSKWHKTQEWGKHYYLRFPLTVLWYTWLIVRYRVDIVHPQSRDDFVFATTAGWLLGKKIIWTDHADLKYIMDRINYPHPRMQSWILFAAKKCSNIICVSHSEKEKVIKVAPELSSKLTVVHNGVFIPNARPIKKDCFVVGANSRLVKDKGVLELIEGFAKAKKLPSNSELWVIGGYSNNLDYYAKITEQYSTKNRVKFIGYVSNPCDYVAAFDIFVHPSYHEAFSLAIIEACMLGKPIIATNVGGNTEILDTKSSILIDPKKSWQIAKSIDYLMDNPGFTKTISKRVKAKAIKEFSFDKIVKNKITKIYEK